MKKKIAILIGIVIFWVSLIWYLNACGMSDAERFLLIGVCAISLVVAPIILFREKKED